MRQGPNYSQWGIEWLNSKPVIGVPLELVEELGQYYGIKWVDNGDNTYTLIPRKAE